MNHLGYLIIEAITPAIQAGLDRAQMGLSGLIEANVRIEGVRIEIMPIFDIPGLAGPPDQMVVGIHVGFKGAFCGHGLLMFNEESAAWLAGRLLMTESEDIAFSDQLVRSALLELGNVTVSGFLNGLADWFGLQLQPTTPEIAYDLMAAILNTILASVSAMADSVVSIETTFSFSDNESVGGYLLLLPDNRTLEVLLGSVTGGESC